MREPKILDQDEYDPLTRTVYGDVHRERVRAHHKHDTNGDSMERKNWDELLSWTTVIGEEVGEIDRAICDARHLGEFENKKALRAKLIEEVTQLAAMSTAWLDALWSDLYEGPTPS